MRNANDRHSCASIKNASKTKDAGVRRHHHGSCAWYMREPETPSLFFFFCCCPCSCVFCIDARKHAFRLFWLCCAAIPSRSPDSPPETIPYVSCSLSSELPSFFQKRNYSGKDHIVLILFGFGFVVHVVRGCLCALEVSSLQSRISIS